MHVSCNVKIMYHWYNIEWGSRNNKIKYVDLSIVYIRILFMLFVLR